MLVVLILIMTITTLVVYIGVRCVRALCARLFQGSLEMAICHV